MSHPTPDPIALADDIASQLGRLASQLAQLPPAQATRVIARVLDPDNGVFGRITQLVITGSRFAENQAERGTLPAQVWLALGRAANELNDIALDLDEHHVTLRHLANQPALTAGKPSAPASPVFGRRR
ncbi:hypothetical protein [Streptomyces sp. NPDC006285]|uniref:hypothetical protein n=1 Tax=Streptomyces sp. NPDC006285 TaxID=3364742 RepID=UPI0036803C9F